MKKKRFVATESSLSFAEKIANEEALYLDNGLQLGFEELMNEMHKID